ncbi:MAG: hypothetical protein HYZ26_13375 [Chloroflexi bacterium]|nr:hypothetical protein [Chloroflexota bacterium]
MSDFKDFSEYQPQPQPGQSRRPVLLAAVMGVLVMGAGVMAVLLAAPSEPEPGAVVEFSGMLPLEARLNEFLVLASRGDYEDAYALLSEAGRRGLRLESFRARWQAEDLAGYARLDVNLAELSSRTRVTGTLYFADGGTRAFEAFLEQTGGEWFIISIEFGE